MFRRIVSLLAVCLCVYGFAPPLSAAPDQEPAPPAPTTAGRPKIGLALGGGGARGTAHIGSIIGGLYACGYTPDQMHKLIGDIHWDTLFQDAPERKDQAFRQKEDDF